MLLYLARPIDFAGDFDASALVGHIKDAAGFASFSVFDPANAWSYGQHDNSTQPINFEILAKADALICILSSDTRTYGVPMELGFAKAQGIPILALVDKISTKSVAVSQSGAARCDLDDPALPSRIVEWLSDLNARSREVAVWQKMPDGRCPKIGKPGDAGFDLYYSSDVSMSIEPGARANVPSRIGVQFPPDVWCLLLGRSSSFQRGLLIAPSVIDAGYRGELFACVWNFGGSTVRIEPDERIAQIVPMPLLAGRFDWHLGTLTASERGDTGFGSTGR